MTAPRLSETPDVEAVLAAHEYMLQNSRGSICACGFVPTVDADSLKTQQDYHRAHVAQALAPVLAAERVKALREAAENTACAADADLLRDRADRIAVDATRTDQADEATEEDR